jgi:hypothetical protein
MYIRLYNLGTSFPDFGNYEVVWPHPRSLILRGMRQINDSG